MEALTKMKILRIIQFALREFNKEDSRAYDFVLDLINKEHVRYEQSLMQQSK